jgi:hypothetical protein
MKECYSHSETGIKMIMFNYLSISKALARFLNTHTHTHSLARNIIRVLQKQKDAFEEGLKYEGNTYKK